MAEGAKIARERRWRGHLRAWLTSGLSQAAYCRREGLTANDFSWWKREIARRDRVATSATSATSATPAFVPVSVTLPRSAAYAFELLLRDGRALRFDGRVDPAALGAVVRELEAAGPQPGARPC